MGSLPVCWSLLVICMVFFCVSQSCAITPPRTETVLNKNPGGTSPVILPDRGVISPLKNSLPYNRDFDATKLGTVRQPGPDNIAKSGTGSSLPNQSSSIIYDVNGEVIWISFEEAEKDKSGKYPPIPPASTGEPIKYISSNSASTQTFASLASAQSLITNLHLNQTDITFLWTEEKGSGSLDVFATPTADYYINTKTGHLDDAVFKPIPVGKVGIGWDEAEENARRCAEKYYLNFSSLNFTLVSKYLNDMNDFPWYDFTWYEFTEGVRTPNHFTATISAVNGQIIAFNSDNVPIQVTHLNSLITKEQAENIARQKWAGVNLSQLTSVLAINYIGPGKQALVWEIHGEGKEDAGVTTVGFADVLLVDAINGSIIPYYM